jgi:hypothetical protein
MGEVSKNAIAAPPPPQSKPGEFAVDASHLSTAYANFVRLTGTPEELILDFGLNTQVTPSPQEPVKVSHRLVLDFYTAKRLLGALHWAVERHESVYGALETDIQKRMQPLRS